MQAVSLSGVATAYSGHGRELGYPTANLSISTDLDDGVYFGYADLGEFVNRPAIIFVGVPTTIGDKDRRVEAHLLDIPDEDYYGKNLHLRLYSFHRPNQTFANLDELVQAMRADEAAGRSWFAKNPLDSLPDVGDT